MTHNEQLWITILGQALNAALAEGKLPAERDTVAKAAPHFLSELCDVYTCKQKSAERLAAAMYDLTEALFSLDDEIVKLLTAEQRQQLWTVISMLNQERKKHVRPSEQPSNEASEQPNEGNESEPTDESSAA